MTGSRLLGGLLVLFALTAGSVKANNDEVAMQEVLDTLNDPQVYDKDMMPFNESGAINVRLQMYFRNIEVDDEEMTTTVEMTFRMLWNDDRLKYSTPDVEYVNLIDTESIWRPDPFFKNAIETKFMESVYPEAYFRVTPDGDITYSTRLRVTLRCNMDLSRFPHDEQSCPMQVASYGYSDDFIDFEMDNEIDVADELIYNSRFLVGDEFEISSCDSTTRTGTYSCVEVDMTLDRVSSTYSLEFYLPFIFLVLVAFFSEIVPAAALLPRLLLTLAPLITLASFYFAYSLSLPAVAYARASDIFAGISLLVNFALLIHTIVAYYRSLLDTAEKKLRDSEGGDKFVPSIISRLFSVLDKFMLVVIVIFYIAFIVIYFAYTA